MFVNKQSSISDDGTTCLVINVNRANRNAYKRIWLIIVFENDRLIFNESEKKKKFRKLERRKRTEWMKITTSEKSAADSIRSQRVFDVRTCTVRIVPFFLNSKVAGKTAKKNIIHMHTFVTSPRGRTDARRVDHAGNRNRRTDAPSEIRPEPGGVSD